MASVTTGKAVTACVLLYRVMPGAWKTIHESPFLMLDLHTIACMNNIRRWLSIFYWSLTLFVLSLYLVPTVYLLLI